MLLRETERLSNVGTILEPDPLSATYCIQYSPSIHPTPEHLLNPPLFSTPFAPVPVHVSLGGLTTAPFTQSVPVGSFSALQLA